MNRLIFVRHGENRANLTKEFSNRLIDYSLTPKGVLQAQQTAEYVARTLRVDAVFASPLKRAAETAEVIAGRLGLPVTLVEELREIDVGEMETLPPTDSAWQAYKEVIDDWLDGRLERRFPGGEDYHELWARTQAGLRRVVDGRAGQNVLLVGHGGQFQMTLPDLCPEVDPDWLFRQHNDNCAISEVLIREEGGRLRGELVEWAAAGHLHGEAADTVPGIPQHLQFGVD